VLIVAVEMNMLFPLSVETFNVEFTVMLLTVIAFPIIVENAIMLVEIDIVLVVDAVKVE
jgi:hypothetical protein